MANRDTKLAAEFWSRTVPKIQYSFYTFPPLRNYFYACVTGRPYDGDLPRDWIEQWTVETFLKDIVPVDECLSLCCGFGEIERILAQKGVFKHCTGMDVAAGALEQATQRARQAGYDHIEYVQTDLNQLTLEPGKYDLIWANGALHHLENLELVISQIYKALKPGGYLVTNEYIGPKHQQLNYRQREIINSAIHLIPHRLRDSRESTFVPGWFRQAHWRYRFYRILAGLINPDDRADRVQAWPAWKQGLWQLYRNYRSYIRSILERDGKRFRYGPVWDWAPFIFKEVDPSEGVRADEIIPLLQKTFGEEGVDIRYYNGSVLFYALDQKFYHQFDPTRSEDRIVLDLLLKVERALIEIDELRSDNAHIVARKLKASSISA